MATIAVSTRIIPEAGQDKYRRIKYVRYIDEMLIALTKQLIQAGHQVTLCNDLTNGGLAAYTAHSLDSKVTVYLTNQVARTAAETGALQFGAEVVAEMASPSDLLEVWLEQMNPYALVCFAGQGDTEETVEVFTDMYPDRPIYILSAFGGASEELAKAGLGIHTDKEIAVKIGEPVEEMASRVLLIAPMIVRDLAAKGIS